MHFRRSFVHRVTVLSALGLIFTSAAFGQRLSPGSKPVETKVSRVLEAFCSNLSGGFRACRIMKNEDRDAEFIIQKDSDTVARVDADAWSTVTIEPKDFFAYRGDLDRDGSHEIVLVSLEGVSQGMGVSYATAYIFDGRSVQSGGMPISVPIEEFGDGENFVYDRRTGQTRLLITYWRDYDSIEAKRGSGLYLVGKCFEYKNGRLHPILAEPTLARRFLNSFAAERDNGWFENRKPLTWLRDRRTHKLSREPKPSAKLVKARLGTVVSFAESDGDASEFKIVIDGGEMINTRLGHLNDEEKSSAVRLEGVGIRNKDYLYPNPRRGGLRLSSFVEKIEGRRVRVETYKGDYGEEFTRLWLLN